jgi:hypothetical protein
VAGPAGIGRPTVENGRPKSERKVMEKVECLPMVGDNGMSEIWRAILDETGRRLSHREFDKVTDGRERVTRQGKMSKRIKRNLKRIHNITLSDKTVTQIGNIMNKHSMSEREYLVEYTTDLYGTLGRYGDHGSCFKEGGCCREDFEDMDDSGHYSAFRVYRMSGSRLGRAWVFNAPDGAKVLFNAYGMALDKIAILAGKRDDIEQRRVMIEGDVYINDPYVYAIGGAKIQEKYFLETGQEPRGWHCAHCEDYRRSDPLYPHADSDPYCGPCYNELFYTCNRCGAGVSRADEKINKVYRQGSRLRYVCDDCLTQYIKCRDCEQYHEQNYLYEIGNSGDLICGNCNNNYHHCLDCSGIFEKEEDEYPIYTRLNYYHAVCAACRAQYHHCENCQIDHRYKNCPRCGRFGRAINRQRYTGSGWCHCANCHRTSEALCNADGELLCVDCWMSVAIRTRRIVSLVQAER